MINTLCLVGRLADISEIKISENNNKKLVLTIAVPRSYKNLNGEYECDFIDCILCNELAINTKKYYEIGDVIDIKGKLSGKRYKDKNGNLQKEIKVIVEKISFLSSKQKEGNSNE